MEHLEKLSKLYQAVRPSLLFLFALAWDARIRLPVILSVGFMAMDLRMRVEINVNLNDNGPRNVGFRVREEFFQGELLVDGEEEDDDDDDDDEFLDVESEDSDYNANALV